MNTFITALAITALIIGVIIVVINGLQRLVNYFITTEEVPAHTVALHYRDGKLLNVLQPGRHRIRGSRHSFQHFDTRLQQVVLQTQELTTAEGIAVKATATGFYRIIDPLKLTASTNDYTSTIYTFVQLAIRDLISGAEAEGLLISTRDLGPALLQRVSEKSAALGIEFTELVIRDLILPSEIRNVLSEAWRAKKHSFAELEAARGKAAATRTLANAAKLYETNPSLLKVRYLEALEVAAKGMGNTFVIGMNEDKALSLGK